MGSGYRAFATAEVLTAANVNNYLMTQSVMYFATTAARDAAIISPVDGMVAYIGSNNSSEGLTVFNGSTWRLPWNMPWGVQGTPLSFSNSGTATTAGTTETTMVSSNSFTAVAGRYYRVSYTGSPFASVATDLFTVKLRWTNTAGAVLAGVRWSPPGAGQSNISMVGFGTTTAGSGVAVLTGQRILGTGTLNANLHTLNATLIVEDMGPSAGPV